MRQNAFRIVLAGLGLLVVSSGFCFAEVPAALSQWAAAPPKLDGLAGEWRSDSVLHDKKLDLDYGFKNDDRNLYILLVFRNPKFLSSIETLGILISGGLEGTKENGSAVRFVKKMLTADQYITLLESRGASPTDEEREKLRKQSRHAVFAAYAVDKKGKIIAPSGASPDAEPPAFETQRQGNVATYEFRIPLASRSAHPRGNEAEPGATIKVSFKWGGSAQRTLSTRTSWSTPWAMVSGDAIADNAETRAQEFLNSFDSMSRPSLGGKKYSLQLNVRLAEPAGS